MRSLMYVRDDDGGDVEYRAASRQFSAADATDGFDDFDWLIAARLRER